MIVLKTAFIVIWGEGKVLALGLENIVEYSLEVGSLNFSVAKI